MPVEEGRSPKSGTDAVQIHKRGSLPKSPLAVNEVTVDTPFICDALQHNLYFVNALTPNGA